MNKAAPHAVAPTDVRENRVFSPYLADVFIAARRRGDSSASRRGPVLEARIEGCDFAFSLGPYLRASDRHLYSVILRQYKPREPLAPAPEPRPPHASLLGDLLYHGLRSLPEHSGFSLIVPIPPKPQEPWERYHLGALMRRLEASLGDAPSPGFGAIQREALRFVGAVPPIKTISPERRFAAIHRMMEAAQVENASVLVVDDILASGATLLEAVRALKAGGARRVAAITLAKRVG